MRNQFYLFLALVLFLAACKKETQYQYQVQTQQLYQNSGQKTNLKTTNQFISIAYNDLFNASITTSQLGNLNVCLEALGDQATMEDMIVKNLLSQAVTQIPDSVTMRANIPVFVTQTYLRFYNRQPTAEEAWKMQSLIQQNSGINPQMVYYSMMTSNEYRYY
jgi:hypothetical protein